MSRTLDNYLQNLINKSTAQFQNALTPLVNQQLERQQQEWEDKRKGSQIADLYKANTAEMLGDDFFNNAKEQRTLADNTRTFLNQQNINQSINKPAQQKSVNEILEELGGTDKILQDGFNNQNSLANYIREYNPVGAGDLIYGKGYQNKDNQGFNINPASSINNYYKSDYSDKLNGRLNTAHKNIEDTLKYSQDTQNNFWNDQYKILNDLGIKFDDYAVNPIYTENGVEDFIQNPLTKQQNRYAELAANGNTIASEHIYNTMYPKMNLRERQYISPDGKTKVNEEILYNISPNGKYTEQVINSSESPYLSQKDLEDYKYQKQLGLIKERAKYNGGSGKDDIRRFTPDKLNEKMYHAGINNNYIRGIISDLNDKYGSTAVEKLLYFDPNVKPIERKYGKLFGFGDNEAEYNKNQKQLQYNNEAINFLNENEGGADFILNPLKNEEVENFNNLGIVLEPTDKLNIFKYIDTEKDLITLLPLSKIREFAEKKSLIKN